MKIKVGNMKNWASVYVLSLLVPINIAQNTPEKSYANVPELKKEFIKLEDVSLSEELYDSNGERVIRTVGISSRLLDRIHSMNCVGIHELALDLLETNRHNQNLLIHNLRKFISHKDAVDVSNVQVQNLMPSPDLKLPSPQKTQQIRKSNLQKNILGEERAHHISKEINSSKQKKKPNSLEPTSKNEQFQHFAQVKNTNRNDQENLGETNLIKKRKPFINASNQKKASSINRTNSPLLFGQMNANVSFEHQEVKGGTEPNDFNKGPHNQHSETSLNQQFPTKNQESLKKNNPDNIHRNNQRTPKRQHNDEVKIDLTTQEKMNFEKTAQETDGHDSRTTPIQDNNNKIKNKRQNVIQKHVHHSNRTSNINENSERSRRENNRKINSSNQGATSIENFLQRYPEIRRISSRFHNDSPQRVLNEHSRKMAKPMITSRTTPRAHILLSTTQAVRLPSTQAVRVPSTQKVRVPSTQKVNIATNSSLRLPSKIEQDKRGTLLSKNNSAVPSNGHNNSPDFDNSYDELSSADYSYLYYQDYYDELVPPHHRFQQLKNRKRPQFKTSSTSTTQGRENIRTNQDKNRNSQVQRQHQRRLQTSNVRSSNNENKKLEHSNSRNNHKKPNQLIKTSQHHSHNNLNVTSKATKTQSQKNIKEENNRFYGTESTVVSVGPFGYKDKGDYFSDESVSGFPEIIDITYQGFVWAITIQYPKKVKKIHGGIHTILKDKVKEKRINLIGDHIIRITGRASPYNINRLTFHTLNGKTYGPFGERQHKESIDFDENAPPGHALAYISGTINFGVPLRSVSFHWRPIESS